jgi:hypothetical protein
MSSTPRIVLLTGVTLLETKVAELVDYLTAGVPARPPRFVE